MHPTLPRRLRASLLWLGFAVAALAAGLAVHRLYATVRREIADQGARALQQEQAAARERIRSYTAEVRRSTLSELTAFHVDGLGYALRQWDEANEIIVGTFQWEATRGFLPGFELPATGPKTGDVARLWQELREWRTSHAGAKVREAIDVGGFHTVVYRTLDNPTLSAADLGYQSENLDILAHAGRPVDPWAGWAGSATDATAPWIFWYQAGPDAPVRGCLVNPAPIIVQLRGEFADTSVARLALVAAGAAGVTRDPRTAKVLEGLPAYRLTAESGDVFRAKESNARLTALVAALLFGLFLLGAAVLTAYTRREAREAERKITFVAQVSHELRTPLTSIRMFADLLGEPGLPDAKRAKFAGTISTESRRLGALIERLLAFNTLELGGKKIDCQPVDVTALVRDTVEAMNPTLRAAGLSPELELPAEPAVALSDASTLKQALLNLLDNAAKYARDTGPLQIALTATPEQIRLRVADRGPGIPDSIRRRLFEPFVQGGQTLTDKSPGVGLGLSLARGLLRQTGADLVWLSGEPGAVFEVRMQRSNPPPSDARP